MRDKRVRKQGDDLEKEQSQQVCGAGPGPRLVYGFIRLSIIRLSK